MTDSYKASAEARAKRIAEKLANPRELEEFVEFLDSAIEQTPASAWKLSDIPHKEQYETCDDSEYTNHVNTLIQAMEQAEPKSLYRPALLRRLIRASEHMPSMVSKFDEIKDFSAKLYAHYPIQHAVVLNSDTHPPQPLNYILELPMGAHRAYFKSFSDSEKSADSPYSQQKFNVEPITPVMQFRTKNTKA